MLEVLFQTNFPFPRSACCQWHCGLKEIISAATELQGCPCRPHIQASATGQCPQCGLLLQDDPEDEPFRCVACNYVGAAMYGNSTESEGDLSAEARPSIEIVSGSEMQVWNQRIRL